MRLEIGSSRRIVTVRISRRNLVAFLGMLQGTDDPVIVTTDSWIDGRPVPGLLLEMIAEPDAIHYSPKRRPFPAGQMPPATEAFIREAERNPAILETDRDAEPNGAGE